MTPAQRLMIFRNSSTDWLDDPDTHESMRDGLRLDVASINADIARLIPQGRHIIPSLVCPTIRHVTFITSGEAHNYMSTEGHPVWLD